MKFQENPAPSDLRPARNDAGLDLAFERLTPSRAGGLLVAAELVRGKVDVILASQAPAVAAARDATRDIPIVMAPGGDPIALGFIAGLPRPGGNITGVSATGAETATKMLEIIRELVPEPIGCPAD